MSRDPDVTVHANPEDIDSKCSANPFNADGPAGDLCGNDAVTLCFRPDGHRSYLCQAHAEQALRFGDDVFVDGAPTLEPCERCVRPTPRHRLNPDKICEECET